MDTKGRGDDLQSKMPCVLHTFGNRFLEFRKEALLVSYHAPFRTENPPVRDGDYRFDG
jgi:hypothetical protein